MYSYATAARGVAGFSQDDPLAPPEGEGGGDTGLDEPTPISAAAKIQFQAEQDFEAKFGHSIPPQSLEEAEWLNDRVLQLKQEVAAAGTAVGPATAAAGGAAAPVSMTPRVLQVGMTFGAFALLLWFLGRRR